MRNLKIFVSIILVMILFSSCADKEVVNCVNGHTYGFFGGLWHGMIAPFDLVGSLIWDDITMYAENNTGAGYAFGFLIGSGGWGLISIRSSSDKN